MRKALIAAVAVAVVTATTALAGGWATVQLSSTPKGLAAGEPWVVDITVLQHGNPKTPLCCLRPTVTIRKVAGVRAGAASALQRLIFKARPTGRTGVYRARVVFPTSGIWRFSVYDGFTTYGGARTHTYAPVRIAAPGT
jgi:hypothetical protein